MLRAQLYGGLAVWVDDRRMPDLGGVKPRSLLAYLLLNPGPHPRARLAGRFWPDVLDTSARGSLRSALWAIRAALDAVGGGDHLMADRAGVGLDPEREREVDAREVDRLMERGDAASLERAVLLGGEPLLPDIPDEWVMDEQDRRRDRMIEALLALADAADAGGEARRGLSFTREALARDRLREPTHRALMRRLAAAGDRAGALAVYRRCRDTLAAELGVAPSAETRALVAEIREGGPAQAAVPPPAAPRAAPPPALIGRRPELARLAAAWAAARAGRGGVVILRGVAGVGKSRLAAELAASAARDGGRVAVGHAIDIDGGAPFGAWVDALRPLVRAVAPPPAAAAWPQELARLCPAVESAWGRHPGPAAAEPTLGRARLFEAVGEAVEWSAAAAPTLLVLEDVHAADASSLALLAHVGARLGACSALALVTVRSGVPVDAVDRARDALARRDGLVDEIPLEPLPRDDVLAVVRDEAPALDPAVAEQVADAAAGSPLIARRAARSAAAGGDPDLALRDAVRAPISGLPQRSRDLVAVASAAGRALTLAEATAVAGAEALDDAVAQAAAAGLLVAGPAGEVAFTHDLVRRACYGELVPGSRRAAHARLAEVLSGPHPRPPAEVAHHLRRAGDDERARAYLMTAAAEARALGALDQAAGVLREAAASARAAGLPAAEGEAWVALSEIEAWRGDRFAMDEAFARARAALEAAGDLRGLVGALADRARWLRTTTCYPEEALRTSREALELLDRAGLDAPEARLLAFAGLAWGEAVAGDPDRGARLQERLGELLDAADDPVLRAEHLVARAFALIRAGDAAGSVELCRRAAELADAVGHPALALDARIGQAASVAADGDVAAVLTILAEPPDPARTGPGLACQSWAGRAHALSRLGRHAEAVEAAEREMAVARRFATPELEAAAAADLGVTLVAAGRAGEGLARIEAALDESACRVPRAALRLSAAEAALAAGDPAAARRHLERFPFEPVGAGDDPPLLVARLDRITGLVAGAEGDRAGAVAHLRRAEESLRRTMAGERSAGAAGEEMMAMMIDLGRPPVAGLGEPAVELERVTRERERAERDLAMAATGGA
ncbi:MAG: AAA family ATPase [Thermoleophilia bacterium]